MRIEDQNRSRNIEDRRRARASGAGGAGSRRGRTPLGGGGLPIGAIAVVLIVVALFAGPQQAMRMLSEIMGGGGEVFSEQASRLDPQLEAELEDRAARVLASTEDVWTALYRRDGVTYREPTLVLYTGQTRTACGLGSSAAGPFYCPPDEQVYIDLSFFQLMEERLNARGDFAQAYVIAHEVGHHIQQIEGVLDWSARARRAAPTDAARNEIQVRIELMADCYAGVWAGQAERFSNIDLESGDLEEAIAAAQAVGDDTLARAAGRVAVPDSFTHGAAEQRARWFRVGYETGEPARCDTRRVDPSRL